MSVEPRRIKKIVRSAEDLQDAEGNPKIPARGPFPDVPAGRARRGAITTQKVEVSTKKRTYKDHVYALTKPRPVEGYVTLTQLASERGIQPQLARIWVNKAKVKKPGTEGWRWKEGSKALKRVRKILGLHP